MTVMADVVVESRKSRAMNTVKNWLMPEKHVRFQKLPETLLRSIRRRSVRVKRTKSLMIHADDKRKSGKPWCFVFLLVCVCVSDSDEEKVMRSISSIRWK